MRDKSLKKFKDKVKGLTIRKHNFEPEKVIARLNRVISLNYSSKPVENLGLIDYQ